MRFNLRTCSYDPEEWHSWFAWHPIVIDTQVVWLERVQRQLLSGVFDDVVAYYRLLPEGER